MLSPFMQGDKNQAERHLNSAFRRHSDAAQYGVNVIELQALSNAYYTPTKDDISVRIHYFRQLRRKEKGGNQMKAIRRTMVLFFVLGLTAVAQTSAAGKEQASSGAMMPHPSHTNGAALTYAELKNTAAALEQARQATAKYQDVHTAEADGYQMVGGDMPGMGIHYVLTMEPTRFDIEKPPLLLYVKNSAQPGEYSLAGVGYFWNAPEGPDGQPLNSPFPKSLAVWHRHENICVLPHLENPHGLSESQCREQGGHFIARTQWLVHAWIWKDNPTGIFSPENPALR
jgi:tetratricopeptide (TPR) repeat protein